MKKEEEMAFKIKQTIENVTTHQQLTTLLLSK